MTVQEIYVAANIKTKSPLFQNNVLLNAMALNNDVSQRRVMAWRQPKSHWSSMHLIKARKLSWKKISRSQNFHFDPSRKCMTTIHGKKRIYSHYQRAVGL
jgi:hypothetical protein